MPPLPQPNDLTSLILRTDFTDGEGWSELQGAVGAEDATYSSDPVYSGVTVQALVAADAAAAEDDKLTYLNAHQLTIQDSPLASSSRSGRLSPRRTPRCRRPRCRSPS